MSNSLKWFRCKRHNGICLINAAWLNIAAKGQPPMVFTEQSFQPLRPQVRDDSKSPVLTNPKRRSPRNGDKLGQAKGDRWKERVRYCRLSFPTPGIWGSRNDARKQILKAPAALLKNKSTHCAPAPPSAAWRHPTPRLPTARTATPHHLLCCSSGRKTQWPRYFSSSFALQHGSHRQVWFHRLGWGRTEFSHWKRSEGRWRGAQERLGKLRSLWSGCWANLTIHAFVSEELYTVLFFLKKKKKGVCFH